MLQSIKYTVFLEKANGLEYGCSLEHSSTCSLINLNRGCIMAAAIGREDRKTCERGKILKQQEA